MDYRSMRPAEFRDAIKPLADITLREVVDDIKDSIVDLKSQINGAEAYRNETGEYEDPIWFGKVKTSLEYRCRLLDIAVEELTQRSERSELSEFKRVLREEFDDEDYFFVVERVGQRLGR